ncbi:hypothetical protein OI18_21970 [Flavihumibacter solisilvae]|uniref:Uncharacterized protein n=1 Tax=Flavihumibacter solisilvae TaxID=1349421 RepID=A0A0C1L8U9_9BACT|nr:hypothetical protein OI18_21970 [Flavihumibacter solisilvae]
MRAYFYYRTLQRNYAYLNEQFNMYGIKYYVRITRYGKTQYDNPFDFDDISAVPNRILPKTPIPAEHMYNYFIFNKRN